jgi:transposase-like protein
MICALEHDHSRVRLPARNRRSARSRKAAALEAFAGTWEDRYPAIIKLWRAHWEQFTPFLAFPPDVRRVAHTTNLIESMNAWLRKVTRNCGQFPSEQAALKVLYLAVRNMEEFGSPMSVSAARGGKRRCKRSRSTSTGESQPHETSHDHLHRRSDAPGQVAAAGLARSGR